MATWKKVVFAAVPVTLALIVALVILRWDTERRDVVTRGKNLNREAWESSYRERGLDVPESGPREGYWGSRLRKNVKHETLGWHPRKVTVPGLLAVEGKGLQRYRTEAEQRFVILLLGGSVGFGAYASSVDTTYFAVTGRELDRLGLPSDLHVYAAGAWKSVQEKAALLLHGERVGPDVVVFLDGLNDLTSGSTSEALYGEEVSTKDGSRWTSSYHAHDYEQRVEDYLANLSEAATWCRERGADLLVALQPSLAERAERTPMEQILLRASLEDHGSLEVFHESYAAMRRGLETLSGEDPSIHFLDCSRAFDEERSTTFADLWHFSDPGHEILGEALAATLAEILEQRNATGLLPRAGKKS